MQGGPENVEYSERIETLVATKFRNLIIHTFSACETNRLTNRIRAENAVTYHIILQVKRLIILLHAYLHVSNHDTGNNSERN